MKRNGFIIAVAAVLIVIFGSLLFIFQVKRSQVAVVTTFGKVTGEPVSDPGAHFRWPWPIQDVYVLDQRIQNFESKFEEAKLGDENIVLLSVYIGWRIHDPSVFYRGFGNSTGGAEKRLGEYVQTAQNIVLSKHVMTDLVSADESKIKFTEIESEILSNVQQQVVAQKYGVEVKFVQIKKLGLPENITKTVFERMKTERDRLILGIQAEAKADSIRIREGANSEAAKMLSKADSDSKEIRGMGEAQAAEYLAQFNKNPELARFNLELAALEQVCKENTTLVLDQTTPPLNLLFKGPNTSATTNSEPVKK
jgi:membrane protease subunit HflC